jgi:hypothetical protein
MSKCSHRSLKIWTEKDRCSWVECQYCFIKGPKKHSITLALLAWVVYLADIPKAARRA